MISTAAVPPAEKFSAWPAVSPDAPLIAVSPVGIEGVGDGLAVALAAGVGVGVTEGVGDGVAVALAAGVGVGVGVSPPAIAEMARVRSSTRRAAMPATIPVPLTSAARRSGSCTPRAGAPRRSTPPSPSAASARNPTKYGRSFP